MKKILFGTTILAACILCSAWQPAQDDALAQSKARGKVIYTELCITCHQGDGKGTEGAFPPLAGSDFLLSSRSKAIHAVKFGQDGEITVNNVKYNNVMPAPGLTDQEVADVMNYVLNSWGNKDKIVSLKEVESVTQ